MRTKHLFLAKALVAASFVTLGAASVPAFAAEPVSLNSSVLVDVVTKTDGQVTHKLMAPDSTNQKVPGAMLVYTLAYHNNLDKPFENFVVTNPLPAAVMLADDGFGTFDVSVNGGKSFGKLAALTVTDANGKTRAAQASDVNALRWVIPTIAAGASGKLEYHGIIR